MNKKTRQRCCSAQNGRPSHEVYVLEIERNHNAAGHVDSISTKKKKGYCIYEPNLQGHQVGETVKRDVMITAKKFLKQRSAEFKAR